MGLQAGRLSMQGVPWRACAFRPLAAPCTGRQPTPARHLQLCRVAAPTVVDNAEQARSKLAVLHLQTAQVPAEHPDATLHGPLAPALAALSPTVSEEQEQLQSASLATQLDAEDRPSASIRTSTHPSSSTDNTAVAGVPITAKFAVGDVVTGRVLSTNDKGSRVEILEQYGVVAFLPAGFAPYLSDEACSSARDIEGTGAYRNTMRLEPNVTRHFKVLKIPNDMTFLGRGPLISAHAVDTDITWERARQAAQCMIEDHETADATVLDTNNGGLIVSFLGIRAFVPWSGLIKKAGDPLYTRESARSLIGQHLEVGVVDFSPDAPKMTVSPRQALRCRAQRSLTVGKLVYGTVVQFAQNVRGRFGVYVELENMCGIVGMLHVSNISVYHVKDPQRVFQEGERIPAIVLGHDSSMADKRRGVQLSTQHLEVEAGDILRNKLAVFDNAPRQAELLQRQMLEAQQRAQDSDITAEEGA